jgi:hypothetical protein
MSTFRCADCSESLFSADSVWVAGSQYCKTCCPSTDYITCAGCDENEFVDRVNTVDNYPGKYCELCLDELCFDANGFKNVDSAERSVAVAYLNSINVR